MSTYERIFFDNGVVQKIVTVRNPLFNDEAVGRLNKWLPLDQIYQLEGRAEAFKHIMDSAKAGPTLGDNRLVLGRAATLANELAHLLNEAEADFETVFQASLGGWEQRQIFAEKLQVLAEQTNQHLGEMASQSRRSSPVLLVSLIAEVTSAAGIQTSVATGSKFYKICDIVFDELRLFTAPDAAIRAFLKG
jgi:hypothetical protein